MAKEVMKTHDLATSAAGLINLVASATISAHPEDEVARLMEKICQLSVDSKPVNLSEAITCLTSTIICRVGFGKRYAEKELKEAGSMGCFTKVKPCYQAFASLTIFLSWVGSIDSRGSTINVFLAGTDTSAATLIWVMSFLMKNPKCLKKTQDEVRDLFGKRGRDPDVWENPEEFCPERFIGSSIDFKGQHFELIPFGAGRRICPGMRMGVATVELALANLLYKFDWEMPSGMNVKDIDFDVLPGITTHKKTILSCG
ncbi:hypothetical protein GQ457_01G002450 [Hibiscus cannabinus]